MKLTEELVSEAAHAIGSQAMSQNHGSEDCECEACAIRDFAEQSPTIVATLMLVIKMHYRGYEAHSLHVEMADAMGYLDSFCIGFILAKQLYESKNLEELYGQNRP